MAYGATDILKSTKYSRKPDMNLQKNVRLRKPQNYREISRSDIPGENAYHML